MAAREGARRRRHPRSRWVTARKAVQLVALAAFIVLFVATRRDGLPGAGASIPMRLDPLLVFAHTLAARALAPGSALALLLIFGSLVFGRAWCGWLCPLGTTLDLIPPRTGLRAGPPDSWRRIKYVLLLVTLAAAVLGNLSLLFFDPLAIFQRTLSVSFWPALDWLVTWMEQGLYQVPALAEPVSTLDAWLRPAILPAAPTHYRDGLLLALLFAAILALEVWAPRFWCRYICALGGLLGLLSKPALFQRRLREECRGCTLCTDRCPTGTIDPGRGYASDPGECTLCMDCLDACPRGLTTFRPQVARVRWSEYDPSRRDALFAMGAALAAVAVLRSGPPVSRRSPALLRPPGVSGVDEEAPEFTPCTRCAECIRICPTGGLQPAVAEAGVAGFGSPILVPRLGYCDYSCNACGQVCPVEAIPPLSLDEKRLQVIGRAYIEQDRCIAWSDRLPCIVCQEMCPLPEKAIQLEEAQLWARDGTSVRLQVPHVLRDLCIGCGICEYQCPVTGEAAIRVYSDAS